MGVERRQRVGSRPLACERIGPGQAGDAHRPFGRAVIRLKLVVGIGPIGVLLVRAKAADHAEVVGMEAVEIGSHVDGTAAHAGGDPAQIGAQRGGGAARGNGVGIGLHARHKLPGSQTARLVAVVVAGKARPFFDHQHLEPSPGERKSKGPAPGPAANEDRVVSWVRAHQRLLSRRFSPIQSRFQQKAGPSSRPASSMSTKTPAHGQVVPRSVQPPARHSYIR